MTPNKIYASNLPHISKFCISLYYTIYKLSHPQFLQIFILTMILYFIKKATIITLLLGALASMVACVDHANNHVSAQRKSEADSIVRQINDIDTLKLIYSRYQADDNAEGQMMTLKQLGKCQRERNQFTDAIESHTKGQKIAVELCDTPEIVYALNNIGTNYRRMSMLEDATTFHYRALKYCEDYSDKESYSAQKNRVVSLNGIGNISLRLGDYQTADSVFRQALAGEKALGSPLGQAINYANLGAIFEYNNQIDSAWAYYRKSLEMNIEAKSDLGISLCYGYFGGLHEKAGDIDNAIIEYNKAFEMKDKIDAWHWLNSCLSLAQLHLKHGNTAMAHKLLIEAENVALTSRSRDHLSSIYTLLSELYENAGNQTKAFDYYKKSRTYNDSIVSEKNLVQIQNERVQYEYQRRQQEIDTLQAGYDQEKTFSNIMIWAMIAIAILSVAIIILLLYALQMRKKRHQALQEIDNVRTSFFTNITHEFRTPLTVIVGVSEELARLNSTEQPEKVAEMSAMVARQGRNLLLLVNQILDITKMKSVASIQEYKHGDIAGYIHTVVECTRELANRKHISLLFSPRQSQIEMDFIPDYINKIITNLVANAIKFTPEHGRIYITADEEGDNLQLCVADNGCGIARNEIPHIFDVFYQGKNSKFEVGSGVGLSLVRQLVEAMNGNIVIKSAENEGTVFIITLPMKQGSGDWDKISVDSFSPQIIHDDGQTPMIETTDDQEDDKPIILVVEDNNDILSYIGNVISDAHVHYAHNGQEGFEIALDIIPDIIITDIMMPGMDGLEMCRQIRQSEILNHIPVIAITAKSTEKDKIEGIKAGINAYIYKPFNADELNATIDTTLLLRRHVQDNFARNNFSGTATMEAENGMNKANQAFINKVIDIIYTQMAQQNVNPTEIAAALCMCTKQLGRKITAITGESMSKYILQVRMNKAQKLLDSKKGYSVAEVAHLCGYEENSNFTRAFKQVFGITPSQYLKQPK